MISALQIKEGSDQGPGAEAHLDLDRQRPPHKNPAVKQLPCLPAGLDQAPQMDKRV